MKNAVRMITGAVLMLGVMAIAMSAVGAGCSAKAVTGSSHTPTAIATTEETGYRIKVMQNGKQIALLSLTQLQTLPAVTFSAYQRTETGPTLLSVLKLAGIDSFSKITISGMLRGRVATGELTLARNEVTDEVILDFSNQGTAKLAGSEIPFDNWIIDVSEMGVE